MEDTSISGEDRTPEDLLQQKCIERTGNNESYQNYLRKTSRIFEFVRLHVTKDEEMRIQLEAILNGQGPVAKSFNSNTTISRDLSPLVVLTEFSLYTCPRIDMMTQFYDQVYAYLERCLVGNETLAAEAALNITKAAHQFACENNSEKLNTFIESGGFEPFNKELDAFGKCFQRFVEPFPNWRERRVELVFEISTTTLCT